MAVGTRRSRDLGYSTARGGPEEGGWRSRFLTLPPWLPRPRTVPPPLTTGPEPYLVGIGQARGPTLKPSGRVQAMAVGAPASPELRQYVCQPLGRVRRSATSKAWPGTTSGVSAMSEATAIGAGSGCDRASSPAAWGATASKSRKEIIDSTGPRGMVGAKLVHPFSQIRRRRPRATPQSPVAGRSLACVG